VVRQRPSQYRHRGRGVPSNPLTPVHLEQAVVELDELKALLREYDAPPLIVEPPLFSPGDTTHRHSAIHDRDGLGVLDLAVLDHEVQGGIVGIDGQPMTAVASQEVKAVLAERRMAKKLIAEIENVGLIPAAWSHWLLLPGRVRPLRLPGR